eukprot:TRINITY_DN47277_c0_g1_i1.p1 TRINITY_DN47277_c0_g1~~TRINITY_DN47277_c0_g1_i1.p1  ORF type:complete len:426 (+),score=8.70 TRINITY_DN47277_c0_g1_i1:55-1332(+)
MQIAIRQMHATSVIRALGCRSPLLLRASDCSRNHTLIPVRQDGDFDAHSLTNINRRISRLKQVLSSLVCPKQSNFVCGGRTYCLPLRGTYCSKRLERASFYQIHYAIGFFDGDGCVTGSTARASCELTVAQSIDNVEVLLFFLNLFGGAIYHRGSGTGTHKAMLVWKMSAAHSNDVAHFLAQAASTKQQQLQLGALWPNPPGGREVASKRLQTLKRTPPSFECSCTWPYFAGFFDAEGHIQVHATSASLHFQIDQKYVAALLAIQSLLKTEWPHLRCSVNKRKVKRLCYRLSITTKAHVMLILQRLLDTGLICKRASVELALRLTPANRISVREELLKLTGNQSRYQRLDAAGCARSRDIQNLRAAIRRMPSRHGQDYLRMHSRFEALRRIHKLRTSAYHLHMLRCDIRKLLQAGARRKILASSP